MNTLSKRNIEKLLFNQSNKYYYERVIIILQKKITELELELHKALKVIDKYYLKEKMIERAQRRKTLKERKNKRSSKNTEPKVKGTQGQ